MVRNQIVDRFEEAWRAGERPNVDDFLPADERERQGVLLELAEADLRWRLKAGESARVEHYLGRYSILAGQAEAVLLLAEVEFAQRQRFETQLAPEEFYRRFPQYEARLRASLADCPEYFGRYRVKSKIGSGGFGAVYLGRDEELQRDVAIKVPHRHRLARREDADAYLREARTVAGLDHPNIVPVYDLGRSDDGFCFVVSRLIEGSDLARQMNQARLSFNEAAALAAAVADALHFAHTHGVVHRDVKPGNILLDYAGTPYLADFGLALKEEDQVARGLFGTPAYMSPEQANGEGHRVDGRSDVYSLGVVLYELLTRRLPFRGDSLAELLEQIASVEARPPRQIDDAIPKELERVTLKALSKRCSERHSTALDMADDLRQFLATAAPDVRLVQSDAPAREAASVATPDSSVGSNRSPVHIVPKGLRSFDAHDADFFLELVPGPRDRQGLPDSIRFWKTRIEETDSDNTFAVGLIYGPSGCGKSSLVKAGLLPRLAKHVNVVYVEATAEETESRLLAGLRKRCGDVPPGLGLKETLSALRRGDGAVSDRKVLIVLDQFEQWLHARKDADGTELVQAFRQCDGGRVQCLVMVRDDFWLAVSRLFQEMEVRIVEGQNSALVDLFDRDHACHVLTALGKAFGKIRECGSQMTKEQREFVNQAVAGLSREGRVVCVRLALFAEMMKNKAWLPATLREMGGIEGVGLTFLEETFSAPTAPPEHRRHQQAARAVLRLLLLDSAADLKGQMRSRAELLAAAGYAGRGHDFDELLRILDSEVRLITPTDPEGKEHAAAAAAESGAKFYQLTHDYLVHSLRDWLTRKQKETRRGRAELLLVDRATVWNGRPENRQLPSLFQWLQIERLVARSSWTPPQRKMMSRARRLHGARLGIAAALAIAAALVGVGIRSAVVEKHNATHAADLVQGMLDVNIAQVPDRIHDVEAYRHWADPLLRKAFDAGKPDSPQKLRAALALLPVDAALVDFLYGRLLTAKADEVPVICAALEPHKSALVDPLWKIALSTAKDAGKHRLQAAAALALYDPESKHWADADKAVCGDFVVVPGVYLSSWIDSLYPVRSKLLPRLEAIYLDPDRPDYERAWTAKILAEFAADNAPMLYKLLLNADEQQFATVFPKLQNVKSGEAGMRLLTAELSPAVEVDENANEVDKERLAKRRANVAVALLKMKQPANVWPLLIHREDPRLRSYFIHRIASLHAGANAIVERLDSEKDITARRALILALGEIGEGEVGEADFPPERRQALLPKLHDWYVTTDDAGFHAAVEWLLRNRTLNDAQWTEDQWLKQTNENWANDKERSKQEQKAIRAASQPGAGPRWYVNGQGQTMVVVPRPGKFTMGAHRGEVDTEANEQQHPMTIDRTYAVSAKLVTIKQFQQFDPHYLPASAKFAEDADQPAVSVDWYAAARYCNWLSEKEGIPAKQWCYENGGLGPSYGFRLKANYLSLNGYRLPTEAEMEYAMRAGAKTSRFYGETDELLPKYAWFARNSKNQTWPVGRLKPNDFGLFDAQGNAYTWCQEHYPRPDSAVDQEDVLTIDPKAYRSARGGCYYVQAWDLRSASRDYVVPTNAHTYIGFRVARTCP